MEKELKKFQQKREIKAKIGKGNKPPKRIWKVNEQKKYLATLLGHLWQIRWLISLFPLGIV